ncbi:MAG: glycosyltransferase family 4 protein [Desulfobacterales bacterium]
MYIPFDRVNNIGFVSTRFAGTDGVSLETAKWAKTFESEGLSCFYFAGESDLPKHVSYRVDEAHFRHPDVKHIYDNCFGVTTRNRDVTDQIHRVKERLKDHLYRFVNRFHIDLLISENALTIPLNIPLGIALTELIAETGIATIAHHHDFFWERQAFKTNAVWAILNMAFPPHLKTIRHVVINSSANNQLSLRTGISSTIIPNVMDFESPPAAPDDYADDVRESLGLEEDDLFILQPTRVVKRKCIEQAIELVSRLGQKAKLIISHASGDEGYEYEQRVRKYSELLKVNTQFVATIINERRGVTPNGRKIYTLADIYPYADLVTYPSNVEGFGNAFLEAIYYRKPILVNRYSNYDYDIKPKGFQAIEIDGYVTDATIEMTHKVLSDPALRLNMVDTNYEIATLYYSCSVLKQKLMNLMVR